VKIVYGVSNKEQLERQSGFTFEAIEHQALTGSPSPMPFDVEN